MTFIWLKMCETTRHWLTELGCIRLDKARRLELTKVESE